jgi:hypothetical protein
MSDTTSPTGSPAAPPLDLTAIQETADPPKNEPEAKAEKQSFEEAKQALALEDFANEIKARREFANRIFTFMIVWMVVMVVLVVGDAVTIPYFGAYISFHLSDAVLITLVTTTTATVVSVFLIVAKYLYRVREP